MNKRFGDSEQALFEFKLLENEKIWREMECGQEKCNVILDCMVVRSWDKNERKR